MNPFSVADLLAPFSDPELELRWYSGRLLRHAGWVRALSPAIGPLSSLSREMP